MILVSALFEDNLLSSLRKIIMIKILCLLEKAIVMVTVGSVMYKGHFIFN